MKELVVEVKKLEKIYEGKAKIYYRTDRDGVLIQEFKDHATAFDGEKFAVIEGKGYLNARISALLFRELKRRGLENHYVDDYDDKSHLVLELKMIPVEVVVRNIAAGSLVKRLGFEMGKAISPPIVEYYLKADELHDPIVNRYHIKALGIADDDTLDELEVEALKVNDALVDVFNKASMKLVDFKLEYGRARDGCVILGDEITPDTCRLWDRETDNTLDKDRFRFDKGDLIEGYRVIYERLLRVVYS